MIKKLKNLNNFTNFALVSVHSDKKNKDYYAIAMYIDKEPIILKFLTTSQSDVIINMKGE